MEPINISNDPITGLKRKVTVESLSIEFTNKKVILRCSINFYDQSNQPINNTRIHTYVRDLYDDGAAFDAWYAQAQNPINLLSTIQSIVALRDSEGKFDI